MGLEDVPARVIGLLLAGGTGSRLGRDKGLLSFAGRTFAEICAEELSSATDALYVSLRPGQAVPYASILAGRDVVFDRPLSVGGPLRGLLSLLDELPDLGAEDGVLALSTDMPRITRSTLLALKDAFVRGSRSMDGVFYERAGQLEPLCGIYRVSLLRAIHSELEAEARANCTVDASLRGRLDGRALLRLSIEKDRDQEFTNVNTAEDLRSLEMYPD